MAIHTRHTERAVVRILVTGSAGGERKATKYLIFVAGHACDIRVSAFQRIACCGVIKDRLLERAIGGMTAFAIREPSAMWIFVTRFAIGAQSQERARFVAGATLLDVQMLTR